MEIKRAEKMGFCFGVEKAVQTAYEVSKKVKSKKYILGMLVHNKEVVKEMQDLGFEIVAEEDVMNGKVVLSKEDTIIIRAHGTTLEIKNILLKQGVTIIDATCAFVKKIKVNLKNREKLGDEIIFIGDKDHPEVKGIISYGEKIKIFKNLKEIEDEFLITNKRYSVLTQTTLNKKKFLEIKEYLKKNYSKLEIFDSICGATSDRQSATEKIAHECDIVLVVGDKTSSNTKKLLEISKAVNPNSYLIQNDSELDLSIFLKDMKIGITAGASTPEQTIKKIENTIKGVV